MRDFPNLFIRKWKDWFIFGELSEGSVYSWQLSATPHLHVCTCNMNRYLNLSTPIDLYHGVSSSWFYSKPTHCNQTEAGRNNSLVPCAMNVSINYCYWKQGTWPRWWQHDKGLLGGVTAFKRVIFKAVFWPVLHPHPSHSQEGCTTQKWVKHTELKLWYFWLAKCGFESQSWNLSPF